MIPPYTILARYEPLRWRASLICKELCELTYNLGFRPLPIGKHRMHKALWVDKENHADVMRTSPTKDISDLDWHQDGMDTGAELNCGIILWTDKMPTEIRYLNNKTIWTGKPFEVIYFNNKEVMHRRQKETPAKRWLFRQRVINENFSNTG